MNSLFYEKLVRLVCLGLVLTVSSCRSPLMRNNPAEAEDAAPALQAQVPEAKTVMSDQSPPEPVAESSAAAVEEPLKPAGRPWYKRLWRRGENGSAEVSETDPGKIVEAKAEKPAETAKAADGGSGKAKKVREEPAVEAVSGEDDGVADSPVKRPWFKFWGGGSKTDAVAVEKEEAKRQLAAEERRLAPEEKGPELPSKDSMFSASGEPLIRRGYVLRISVSAGGKMEVQEQIKTVSGDGEIALPLVGAVKCEGLTLKQAAEKLETQFEKYIRDPQASVDFVYSGRPDEISPWGSVVVQGWVRNAGRVNIPPTRDLTVSRALQLVGGGREGVDEENILVTRRKPDGTIERVVVDLVAIAKRGEYEKDIVLQHGDRVFVRQQRW